MSTISTHVATEQGAKYIRQLCKHWSHKLETQVEEGEDGEDGAGTVTGTVTFPSAVTVMQSTPTAMVITLTGESREELERLTDVVARHIDRFAFREAPLAYDWQFAQA